MTRPAERMFWRNDRRSYGLIAILFHWLVAILFLCQLPLGYLTQVAGSRPALQFSLYQWHKSIGFLILALAWARLAWSLGSAKPAAPAGISRLERAAARLAHAGLLAATILVPLTGWLVASASPLRIPSFVFNLVVIPPLPVTPSAALETFWSNAHAVLAYAAGILALAHALAALRHHLLLRDNTLRRMLTPGRGPQA